MKYVLLTFLYLFFLPSDVLSQAGVNDIQNNHESHSPKSELWTCSMHPQIKLKKPGKCPICNMDLILVDASQETTDLDTTTHTLSVTAEKLAEIETYPVERKSVSKEIRLFGLVDYDETKLTHITAWVPGRIDRMFIDYKGITVNKGDHMLEIYSPELLSSQEELIQASKSLSRLQSGSALIRKSTEQTLIAAREKLILLGLTNQQVREIERSRKTKDHVTIYAPNGGIVVEKNATEGMYVQTGTRIYSIADLSRLWIYLDAYETDLPWIRYGQKLEFSTQAIPGKKFSGKISFISPIVDESTRTTKVRVSVDNSKGLLKPGLFVNGIVKANIYGSGKVMDTSLKGKYIGPMHPEIVQSAPGKCPVCGMDLLPAEELGYITTEEESVKPLVIPKSAPLLTGTRAVVYVKAPDSTTYNLRNVTLGPIAGDSYIVESGLHEGELVVSKGAFKIDADLQIRGKRSMMNPEGMTVQSAHNHGTSTQIKQNKVDHSEHSSTHKANLSEDSLNFLNTYLHLSEVLASDNLEEANKIFVQLKELNSKSDFSSISALLENSSLNYSSIESAREMFFKLSNALISELEEYSVPPDVKMYKAHCPMAMKGAGANWIQRGKEVRNPYYGASMLSCGSIKGEL